MIKGLGCEIVRKRGTVSSLRLLPPTRSECKRRRLHFSCKHLQRRFSLSLSLLSHQFISCCCVKDGRLRREMLFCLLILEKVTFRQFAQPSHVAELSHHFSATQFTVPRTEAISQEEGGKKRERNAFLLVEAPPITSQGPT